MINKLLNATIGKNVEKLRKETEYNQQDMADLIGLSRASYVNLVHGRGNWLPIYVFRMCQIFSVRPNDLFPPITKAKILGKTTIKKRIVFKEVKKFKAIAEEQKILVYCSSNPFLEVTKCSHWLKNKTGCTRCSLNMKNSKLK